MPNFRLQDGWGPLCGLSRQGKAPECHFRGSTREPLLRRSSISAVSALLAVRNLAVISLCVDLGRFICDGIVEVVIG